jgi:glycosyltransferase involved in cell wall biosynthesis
MCVYNHASYVGGALEAILAQSYQPLEIIVVDDGSTDGGAAVIAGYARREPRIRFLSNGRNEGLFFSIEKGLALVRGDYVFGAAADDLILPGLFEKSMELLARHPEAGLCSALSGVIGTGGEALGELWVPFVAAAPVYVDPERALEILDRHCSWFAGTTVIYRRRALLEAGGFRPELGSFCDGFVYLVLARKHGACFIPELLASWRKTDRNYSSRVREDPRLGLDIMERAARLMRTTYRDLFPADFVARWERKWFLDLLDGMAGAQRQALLACSSRVPGATAWDRIFFRLLRLQAAGGTLLTKAYAFTKAGPADRRRIARSKVRKVFSGRGSA